MPRLPGNRRGVGRGCGWDWLSRLILPRRPSPVMLEAIPVARSLWICRVLVPARRYPRLKGRVLPTARLTRVRALSETPRPAARTRTRRSRHGVKESPERRCARARLRFLLAAGTETVADGRHVESSSEVGLDALTTSAIASAVRRLMACLSACPGARLEFDSMDRPGAWPEVWRAWHPAQTRRSRLARSFVRQGLLAASRRRRSPMALTCTRPGSATSRRGGTRLGEPFGGSPLPRH